MVWVAGPISGLIVQPIIGVVADQSTSKWGRRRPIIVIGSAIVACSLITLGFTKEIVAALVGDSEATRTLTIMLAVLSLYTVDFAINAGKALCSLGDASFVLLTVSLQSCPAREVWLWTPCPYRSSKPGLHGVSISGSVSATLRS